MKFIKKTLSSVASNAVIAFVLAKSGVSLAYGKIKEKANAANMTLKEYVGNDENIGHISLVFYDVLPLAFKLGLRYEKFHDEFAAKFKTIRSWIYKYDEEQKAEPAEKQNIAPVKESETVENFDPFASFGDVTEPVKPPRKRVVKKKPDESLDTETPKKVAKPKTAVKTPAKKTPVKRAPKKVVVGGEK